MKILFILSLLILTSCLSSKPGSLEDASGHIPGASSDTGDADNGVPKLPMVIPQLGSTTVATNVTVRGLSFVSGEMDIEFGGVPCTNLQVLSSTQITCTVAPQPSGSVGIVVLKSGSTLFSLDSGFIFVPEPGAVFGAVSVMPYLGSISGGTLITLIGSGFTSNIGITIGNTPCGSVSTISSSLATCITPPGTPGNKDIVLTKGSEQVTLSGGFKYVGSPTVSTVSPTSGPATLGTNILIAGQNFVSGALVTLSTTVGTYYCQNVNVAADGQSLTCLVPAMTAGLASAITTAANISIVNPDGQAVTLNSSFTYLQPPVYSNSSFTGAVSAPPVDGVLSNAGVAIDWSITGQNFSSNVKVRMNGVLATNCSRISSGLIKCTSSIPSLGTDTGNYTLTITNGDNQFDNRMVTFAGRPVISSITPSIVAVGTTTDITVNGSNLSSHDSSNPIIKIRNPANTTELGNCNVVSNTDPLICTFPNLATSQANKLRYTNSFGYRADFSSISTDTLAEIMITYPAGLGDIGGEGKAELGRIPPFPYKIGVRLNNLSPSYSVSSLSIDASALSNTPYTFDAVNSTCGATIAPSGYCNLIFNFDASSLIIANETNPIVISYHNGTSNQTKTFKIGKVVTVPLKVSRKLLTFGDIPHGPNHNGTNPRMIKILQIHNRSNRNLPLKLNDSIFSSSQFRFAGGGAFPGVHPGSYATTTACPSSGIITPDLKCSLFLEYRPTTSGSHSETLTLAYGDYNLAINLSGSSSTVTSTACNPAGTPMGGGAGTTANPYLICSVAQFANIYTYRSNKMLVTDNLDFSAISSPSYNLSGGNGELNGGGFLWKMGPTSAVRFLNPDSSAMILKNMQMYDFLASSNYGGVALGALSSNTNIEVINSSFEGLQSNGWTNGCSAVLAIKGGVGKVSLKNIQTIFTYPGCTVHTQRASNFLIGVDGGEVVIADSDAYDNMVLSQANANTTPGGGIVSVGGGLLGYVANSAKATIKSVVNWSNVSTASGTFLRNGLIVGETVLATSLGSGGILSIEGCEVNSVRQGLLNLSGIVGVVGDNTTVRISDCGVYGSASRENLVYTVSPSAIFTMERSFSVSNSTATNNQYGLVYSLGAGQVRDTFYAGKMINAGAGSAAGFGTAAPPANIINTYIANIFNERSLYGTTVNLPVSSFASTIFDVSICTACFFQLGIGNDVKPEASSVYALTSEQMQSNMPGIHDSVNWKEITGYPFPVFQWMDDDFMP